MITIIRMKRCFEVNCCKMMYPCRLNQVLNLEDPEIPYANSTINIQNNLLKTRRRRNCLHGMRRQRIGGHIWPSQVDQPRIDQVLYRMVECRTALSIVPRNMMIQAVLMWMKMRNRMGQRPRRQRDNHSSVSELLKSSSQSHAQRSELSRGPLYIWSGWRVSSASQMRGSWLHASLSNVRLLNIIRLILILWKRERSSDYRRPISWVKRGPPVLIANSTNLSRSGRWSNRPFPLTVRGSSSICP